MPHGEYVPCLEDLQDVPRRWNGYGWGTFLLDKVPMIDLTFPEISSAEKPILQVLAEFAKDMLAAQKKMHEYISERFGEVVKILFETYPVLETIHWRQYTPTWNDGDVCEFSAYIDADALVLNGERSYELSDDDELYPLFDIVSDFLWSVGEPALLELFDDNAEVTVGRDGIEISEYR